MNFKSFSKSTPLIATSFTLCPAWSRFPPISSPVHNSHFQHSLQFPPRHVGVFIGFLLFVCIFKLIFWDSSFLGLFVLLFCFSIVSLNFEQLLKACQLLLTIEDILSNSSKNFYISFPCKCLIFLKTAIPINPHLQRRFFPERPVSLKKPMGFKRSRSSEEMCENKTLGE